MTMPSLALRSPSVLTLGCGGPYIPHDRVCARYISARAHLLSVMHLWEWKCPQPHQASLWGTTNTAPSSSPLVCSHTCIYEATDTCFANVNHRYSRINLIFVTFKLQSSQSFCITEFNLVLFAISFWKWNTRRNINTRIRMSYSTFV